jgi:hypothetical protein
VVTLNPLIIKEGDKVTVVPVNTAIYARVHLNTFSATGKSPLAAGNEHDCPSPSHERPSMSPLSPLPGKI